MTDADFNQDLLQYLNDSPTAYHAVENGAAILRAHGFTQLKETDRPSFFTITRPAMASGLSNHVLKTAPP